MNTGTEVKFKSNIVVFKTYENTLMKRPLVQQMKNVSFSFFFNRDGDEEKSFAALGSSD